MRTVLVTGGAGFLGSHLCDSLLSDGHRVVCLDNLASGRERNIAEARSNSQLTFVSGDVRDPIAEVLDDAVDASAVDRVYHLASRASPVDFDTAPLEIARTNSDGTERVLEFASEHDTRVLFASTSEIYGEPDVHPQSEDYYGYVNPRGDRACYNVSKRYGEMLTTLYAENYDVDVRTVRIFNTYGPRMRPDDGRVVPNFITQALEGRDLTVYGDGSQTRSFVYVSDEIRGIRALMDTPGLAGEVMNVGGTEEVTIERLAETVLELAETDAGLTFEPLPHEDDPTRRRPDTTRARATLDWAPEVDLQTGLRRTIRHFAEAGPIS